MITKYNNKSVALGIVGVALQMGGLLVLGLFSPDMPHFTAPLLVAAMVLGHLLIIGAGCYYAVSKGYSAILGGFGILSFLGLFILAWLPDRSTAESS